MSRFAELLQRTQEVSDQSIAPNSMKQYFSCMNVYRQTLQEKLETPPFPLTVGKLKVFLLFKQEEGRAYSTLNNYVNTVANQCSANNEPNITLCIEFKRFKRGLRRMMTGDKPSLW